MRPCYYRILASFNQISPKKTCILDMTCRFCPWAFFLTVRIQPVLPHAAGWPGASCWPPHAAGWPTAAACCWLARRKLLPAACCWLAYCCRMPLALRLAGACTKMHI
jgi:hypothetical protein